MGWGFRRSTLGLLGAAALLAAANAKAAEPITIGFSMELTGPLAVIGKTGLLGFQIWADDVNRKGGLLGRPVKLVYYDDQSNPANVPSIYSKLCDVDKVDLLISSYGTNLVAPAFPVVMEHDRLFLASSRSPPTRSFTTRATSRCWCSVPIPGRHSPRDISTWR